MAANDPRLGRLLGDRYRVDELIGHGGMSTVYRGFDTQLHRPVAIKIFQHGEEDDEPRWESEVRLLSQLSHPHLVTLHDAHLEPAGGGASYLVMEYVAGSNLQEHLAQFGPSAPLAALVIAQIGEALGSVHSRGIVHRDLKPGNILIESSDLPPLFLRTKLADFGIAHLLGSDRVTRTGTMIGTAAYTSPEQVDGNGATPASDVYSLGLVAIECFIGQPAFPGTPSESLIARLTRDPELPASIPSEWAALLASMTSRDPGLRPSALESALRSRELDPLLPDPQASDGPDADEARDQTERMLPPTRLLPAAGGGAAELDALTTASYPDASPERTRPGRLRARLPMILASLTVALLLIVAAVALMSRTTGAASPTGSPSASTTPTPTVVSTSPTPHPPPPGNGKGDGNGKKNKP